MTAIRRFKDFESKLRRKYGEPGFVVTVSGNAGVGKSTISEAIAKRFGLERVNAGIFFRSEAKKRNLNIYEFMARLDEIGKKDGIDFDVEWDRRSLELAFTRDRLLLEGRLTGALLYNVVRVRIWVNCKDEVVAHRVAKRENKTVSQALRDIRQINHDNRTRYKQKYGIDFTNPKFYNIIIDNSGRLEKTLDEVFRAVEEKLKMR